jgi:hypothetical protein
MSSDSLRVLSKIDALPLNQLIVLEWYLFEKFSERV